MATSETYWDQTGSASKPTPQGAGTWTLSGVATYTGSTTVAGGTLVLTSSNSGNSAGATVSSGGTMLLGRARFEEGEQCGNTVFMADGSQRGGCGLHYGRIGILQGGCQSRDGVHGDHLTQESDHGLFLRRGRVGLIHCQRSEKTRSTTATRMMT